MNRIIVLALMLMGFLSYSQTFEDRIEKVQNLVEKGYQTPTAFRELEQLLQEQPDNTETLRLMGAVMTKMGRYEEAVESINKALSINDTIIALYWERSKIYATKALNGKDFENSLKMAFDDTDVMLGLGAVSTKIYRLRLKIKTMEADHFSNEFKYYTPKESSGWKDDKSDNSKEKFKNRAISAYQQIIFDAEKLIELDPENELARNTLNHIPNKIKSLKQ